VYDFSKLLFLDDTNFKSELAKMESIDLISFLKNCNNKKIKIKYYKRIKKALGGNYLKLIKTAIN
jgi:hypothetical protein